MKNDPKGQQLKKKFSNPRNMGLIFEALREERGMRGVFHSDQQRVKGEALLEEFRQSAPVDDRRLGLHAVLKSLEHHPEEIDQIRIAVARAPEDVQGLVFLHGVVEAFARDHGSRQPTLVSRLF